MTNTTPDQERRNRCRDAAEVALDRHGYDGLTPTNLDQWQTLLAELDEQMRERGLDPEGDLDDCLTAMADLVAEVQP